MQGIAQHIYRVPEVTRKVWFRDHDGKPGAFEVPSNSIAGAISAVRAEGFRTVLVEVK